MVMYESIAKILFSFFPEIQAAYLFGSFGTEFERDESDIDVAILLPPVLINNDCHEVIVACSSQLALTLGKSIDLVNLRLVDTVFQYRILETGRLVLCADSNAKQLFELITVLKHLKLQEERKIILDAIIKSNRILA